ncbi:MAG: N-acetylmuramoyl-L-alanine amidase family protein [Candidatus Dormibacteria bacterium]
MRHRARSLHVTLLALALALLALPLIPAAPVRADSAPHPYVIAIDPGHGGSPDPAHPERGYDSGAIGVDGLLEKDLTLDIAKRLRTQLESDLVHVVLTRTDDRPMEIEQRSVIANASGAALYVSIHLNSYPDPAVGGSLVLYPGQKDADFARVMDQRLAHGLGPHGIGDGGPQLRDDWWIHVTAPAVTVEPAYMSNPGEEAFLAGGTGRETIATAIRGGIETYKPDILTRKRQIRAAAPPQAGGLIAPDSTLGSAATAGNTVLHWLLLIALSGMAVHWRRPLWIVIRALARLVGFMFRSSVIRRNAVRRRRRMVRERSLAAHSARLARPHSAYDELFL